MGRLQQHIVVAYVRFVGVTNDGGRWVFDAEGSVQSFEDEGRYSARKVSDRFTPEMLENYCRALGVRLFDEEFYCGPGVLVIVRDALPPGASALKLIEARERLGLEKERLLS